MMTRKMSVYDKYKFSTFNTSTDVEPTDTEAQLYFLIHGPFMSHTVKKLDRRGALPEIKQFFQYIPSLVRWGALYPVFTG
jgi:hypothetical protein